MADPTTFYTIASRLLNDVNTALAETDAGAPGRACVVPGNIAWDGCDCGQLAVSVRQQYFSSTFPYEAESLLSSGVCGPSYIVADMVMEIVRCAASPRSNEISPSMEALDENAQTVIIDAYVVRNTIACTLQDLVDSKDIAAYINRLQLFVGPEGGCVGSEFRFTVGLYINGFDGNVLTQEPLSLRGPAGFYSLASRWADNVSTSLAALSDGQINRIGVVPGMVAWDECDCGQLATTIRRTYVSDSLSPEQVFPLGADGACQPIYLVADMTMDLVRCAPSPLEYDNYIIPCDVLDAAAQVHIADSYIMLMTTLCMLQMLESSYSIVNYLIRGNLAIGPLGNCVGSVMQMTVALLQ